MTMQPLYNHTSPETAYLVDDYPYGRTVRCRIRYWLESKPGKGCRLVSQTENPRTLVWNKPKASTYAMLGAMHLDEKGHVQWRALSAYFGAEEALAFVRDFPLASGVGLIMVWATKRAAVVQAYLDGTAYVTINNVPQPLTATERARHEKELPVWQEAARLATAAVEARKVGAVWAAAPVAAREAA
jgi:hypothetical protein